MSRYRVLLNAQNVLAELEGQLQKVGFYTTRVVEASSSEEASSLALKLIQQDMKVRTISQNQSSDPPTFSVEELQEVSFDEATDTGFSFYREET